MTRCLRTGGVCRNLGINDAAKANNEAIEEKLHFFLDFPAFDKAMAMACFLGLPCFISVLMLDEMTFLDFPFFSGMSDPRCDHV